MSYQDNRGGRGSAMRDSVARLSRLARERADSQARHIPWPRLLDARNLYLDWQELYLWARSIMEVEESIPGRLAEGLNQRCPGFLVEQEQSGPKAAKETPGYLRLENWIDDHIFGFAKREGWFNAISFYAVREPRYQRAQAHWSECVEQWKKARPVGYPSFDEWKAAVEKREDCRHLNAAHQGTSSKLVAPERLAEAVARYIDWEALAYWARSALESCQHLPAEVAVRLKQECPGFLNTHLQAQNGATGVVDPWADLMHWIGDRFFQEAKAGGWFDELVGAAQLHPRAIRTQEYADHCDERWKAGLPVPYPTFEEWRYQADAFVD